jgi:hypothetical protein
MPKLPDATDLSGVSPQAARSFVNMPVPDIAGASNAMARGISDAGGAIKEFAVERQKRASAQERFDTKMGLLKAEEAYAERARDLDPLDPDYVEKKKALYREAYAPVLSSVKDPENKQYFDLSTYEGYVNIGVRAGEEHKAARGKKAELDIDVLVDDGRKRIHNKEDPQKVWGEISGAINDNQDIDELGRQAKTVGARTLLFTAAVETRALDGYGKLSAGAVVRAVIGAESSGNPNAVSPKGALGLMQVMPATAAEIAGELGDAEFFKLSEAGKAAYLKRPDVSVRYGTHYLNKQLKRYDGDLEAALIAYNAGAARADDWIRAGRDWDAARRAHPKAKWMDESQPYVEKIFGALGVDRSSAAADPRLRATAGDVLTSVEQDPMFRELDADQQDRVKSGVASQIKKMEEDNKLQIEALKSDMKTAVASDIASVADGGMSSPDLTYETVATVLGVPAAEDWRKKVVDAAEQAQVTGDFLTLPNAEIETTVNAYKNAVETFKGTPEYSRKLGILKKVEEKQKAIVAERRSNPSQAALRYTAVQDAYKTYLDIRSEAARNPNEDRNKTVTDAFGRYVQATTDAQIGFGVPRQGVALVPDDVALNVANLFLDLPATITGRQDNVTARDTLSRVYSELKTTFGDYTDDVIAYSLAKAKPLSRETSETMVGLLGNLAKGKDIRRSTVDTAQRLQDADDADPGLMGFFDWFSSDEAQQDDPPLGVTEDETLPVEDTAGAR